MVAPAGTTVPRNAFLICRAELLHLQHDDIDLDARSMPPQRGRQGTAKSGNSTCKR